MIAEQEKTTPQANPSRAKKLIEEYEQLKSARSNFESYWQSLHDYFYIEAADINRSYHAGAELNVDALYDATTLESADIVASGFMNYLTPPTSKWAALRAKNPALRDNKRIATFMEEVMDQVNYTLNKSNFYNQIIASYKSSAVYGTSAMLEEEDDQDDVRFYSLPIKNICLVEDGRGRISAYFIEFEYTAEQAAGRFGVENLATEMQQEVRGERPCTSKHLFLCYIANRHRRDINKIDKKNMPIEAVWLDKGNKITVSEEGYNEFPAFCHRFDKRPFIPWGFSPAMKALPFARLLNACAKTNLRSMMKHTDPPIALPDNAFLMPWNSNPRAVNYYNKNKMDAKDIFAFGNYGNPQAGMGAVEYYAMQVKKVMFNDVFLAFDGITKQMNNPEVMERINEKMTLLGPAVGRYISEMLNPIIIRTIGILARKGKLPPPPDEFLQDPQFEIDCISQLAQAQRRSELNALVGGMTLISQLAPQDPSIMDKISMDQVVDEAWNIIGAPSRVLRTDEEVSEIRQAKAQAAQQAQQMNMLQQGADAIKTGSEVDLNRAKANAPTNSIKPSPGGQ